MGCVRKVHNSSHAQALNYVCTSFNNNPPHGIFIKFCIPLNQKKEAL